MDWYRLLPQYWHQNAKTDYVWDGVLNASLDMFPIEIKYYTAIIGPVEVWIANWPYAYGKLHHKGAAPCHGLPSVRTRKRLRKMIRSVCVEAELMRLDGTDQTSSSLLLGALVGSWVGVGMIIISGMFSA